jgi:chromosome segregation ATPase
VQELQEQLFSAQQQLESTRTELDRMHASSQQHHVDFHNLQQKHSSEAARAKLLEHQLVTERQTCQQQKDSLANMQQANEDLRARIAHLEQEQQRTTERVIQVKQEKFESEEQRLSAVQLKRKAEEQLQEAAKRYRSAAAQVAQLEAEKEELRLECVICLDRAPSVVYLPCGHLSTCQRCDAGLREQHCPKCRQKIQSRHQVYVA